MSILSYTSNFRFRLIDYASFTWHDDEYANWNLLDGLLFNNVSAVPFAVDTGAANAILLAYVPPNTALTLGLQLSFTSPNAQAGPTTVDVDGLGPVPLLINGIDPDVGDLDANIYISMIYDGANFLVIQPNRRNTQSAVIFIGPSGATADPSADDFVIESNTDLGQSFLSPAGTVAAIYFGRPTLPKVGGIVYDHSTDIMSLRTANVDHLTIDSAGVVAATEFDGKFVGNLTGDTTGTHTGDVLGDVTGVATTADAWTTARKITVDGDVSGTVTIDGSADETLTIAVVADKITNTMLANMATMTVKSNLTGGSADPVDNTVAALTAVLTHASTVDRGTVQLATGAEAVAGIDTEKAIVPTTLQFALSAISSGKFFQSTTIALTFPSNGTVAHGLGGTPELIQAFLVCTNAINGYSVGDQIPCGLFDSGSYNDVGIQVFASGASNIKYQLGDTGIALPDTAGIAFLATSANFTFFFRAWRN